jgi:acetyltransferase
MRDCVSVGVKGAIIISAGFKETGPDGAVLENEIMKIARGGNMRVIGPNCLGVMVRSRLGLQSAEIRLF